MEVITITITAVFVAGIFFSVIFAIFFLAIASLYGLIRALYNKRYLDTIFYILFYLGLHMSVLNVYQQVNERSTPVEHHLTEKEQYVQEWIFPEESIALERTNKEDNDKDVFYVMTEKDKAIYQVEIFDEKAFGLYRYSIQQFNDDFRKSSEK